MGGVLVLVQTTVRLNCVKDSPRLRRRTTTSAILPFERPRPGLAKGHAPEVGVRRNELESEDSLSFTISPRRHYFALHRLSRVLIEQHDGLVRSEFRVQGNQAPELADGLSVRSKDEIFAVQRLPIHAKRHSQRHARGAAPFDAPVVGNLHVHKAARHVPAGERGRGTLKRSRMLLRSRTSKKGSVAKAEPQEQTRKGVANSQNSVR